ncbi:hypothetical protein Ahy_B05g077722 [Arachis hypogaea]|uniref:Putative plant transposon protein domain-containing protein n=1 Tax=Arachis hypogaea TaxID=3818 RepID=A0A444Z5F2_ARAHY|nr:hypothetical protein Ahy_B05g077722 [Arachis hypogaea]
MVAESTPEFDQWKFRTWYHQTQWGWMRDKKIYPEVPLLLPDDECQGMKAKIRKRRWEELISPITRINANIIWEFYANTPRIEMNQAPTYKSYVRGTEVDFSPNTIMKVLKLRAAHFDKLGYHQRLNEEQNYDEIATENMRALKEFTTLQDARYEVQADYNINSQIKMNYIGEHLHNMDPTFPTFDEFFKGKSEIEVSKAMRLEDRVEEAMNRAGSWRGQQTTDMDTGNTSAQANERRKKKHDK